MKYQTIFDAAHACDFSYIEEYVRNGGDLNICDKWGSSILTNFVYGYLLYEHSCSEQEKLLLDEHEDDDDFGMSFVPAKLMKPLLERNDGIYEQLQFFMDHGADVNLYVLDDGIADTPLLLPVCFGDYYLAEYLLEHGADPGQRITDDGELINGKDYYLLAELDIAILNGARGDYAECALKIAGLLYRYGMTEWDGYCIEFDRENHRVIGHAPRYMY
jgi:ankyrin repeat protein